MACRVAYILKAAGWRACKEVLKSSGNKVATAVETVAKFQPTAEVLVEKLLDAGAMEVKAEL